MGRKRNDEWEDNSEVYTPGQIESTLRHAGVEVVTDTFTHFLCLCPFHGNSDTPALAVDKYKGLWNCFNPSCAMAGNIEELLRLQKNLTYFQAKRVLLKFKDASGTSFSEQMEEILEKGPVFQPFPTEPVERLTAQFMGSKGHDYMKGRHFSDETLAHFGIGYSDKKDMVTVPMHDPDGMLIGFVGRSIEGKQFKNSKKLPKSLTAWNFHRAKLTGDTVIVVEATFDAMRIHQAGYPNVVALLGGSFNNFYAQQLGKTFSTIIVMTDMDKKIYYPNCRKCNYQTCVGHRPGRDLGWSIVERMPRKNVLWAIHDDDNIYPTWPLEGYRLGFAKDSSDMNDDEIRKCLRSAVPTHRYEELDMEEKYETIERNRVA
jgi:DNA primase